ncbi:hypothetical protein D9611_010068 [Ephemerocybe angulata]|uniref:DNA 3'-5' helicase n=1 Tax=Ephemerocybe angulata TaxID=980116 RepID=A0A8H5AZ42_9AGAR|nr:hypothetical protein D9611_010068 [Tulosesus angulatus]
MALRLLRKPSKSTALKARAKPSVPVPDEELEDLAQAMKDTFKWEHSPREFQVKAVKAQLQRKDVLIHAGTGLGKTAVAAGPHAHKSSKGKVTIMVSPLIALQEEQVVTFTEEFNTSAVAINSTHGGLTKEVMEGIRAAKWQVVVISPEMLLSKVFITQVIRHPEMANRVLALVVDEAHVVSHWGSGFRKKYGTLGILKALLPRGTPFVAMSATLPPRVRDDVLQKLQFNLMNFVNLDLGNDRKNVSLVIRAMQHAMKTYRDLWFLIPTILRSINDIKKAFIYADTIHVAREIEEYLYSICPETLRNKGFIRPYSAAFSVAYRQAVMELFRAGKVRILICTDAAGMGCNIPDIDIVVQWKLPASVSSFVQRAGRAARGSGRTGLAVLLVEKAVYEADLITHLASDSEETSGVPEATQKKKKSRKGTVRESTSYPKPDSAKDYARDRGVLRGGHNPTTDGTGNGEDIPLDSLSIDEGLYTLVQTGTCRRRVLTRVFRNEAPEPSVPCCDNCVPALLDQTRPAPPQSEKRASNPKRGVPNISVMVALDEWRVKIAKRDHSKSFFTGSGLLSDDMVELLSSIGPIESLLVLKKLMKGKWLWSDRYATDLFDELTRLEIPPMVPKPKPNAKAAGPAKRTHAEVDVENDGEETRRVRQTITAGSSTASQAVMPEVNVATPTVTPVPQRSAPRTVIAHSGATSVQVYGQQGSHSEPVVAYPSLQHAQYAQQQAFAAQQLAVYHQRQLAYEAEQRRIAEEREQRRVAQLAYEKELREYYEKYGYPAQPQTPSTPQPQGYNPYRALTATPQQAATPVQPTQMGVFQVQEYQHVAASHAPPRSAPPSTPRR